MDTSQLSAFLAHLPKGARVLDAGAGGAAKWFEAQGCSAEEVRRDLRLLSLPRESFDGVWCPETLSSYPIEDCQRVLQAFFQALRPREGMLCVSFIEGSGRARERYRFEEKAFLSLLRQDGFTAELRGERAEGQERWIAVIARRA